MSRWRWLLKRLTRQLWFRASLLAMLGVLTAVFASLAEAYLPWSLPGTIERDAVENLLQIIATSMLAVTTFSLSIMVSAFGSATSNVTPRATLLLMEDQRTQNVLSTFLGAFLFGIVGIVLLKTGAYGERGRIVLFAVTVLVIALVVIMLLRWIDHLTHYGRVGETTARVENAARTALMERASEPGLGGRLLASGEAPPASAVAVFADRMGYVQHVDVDALQKRAEAEDWTIHVHAVPGKYVFDQMPLCFIAGAAVEEEALEEVREAFSIRSERSFDQDPRFGLCVLSEIAQRALSPAINDPGTAIDVIGRQTRLLAGYARAAGKAKPPDCTRVLMPPLDADDLFDDAFRAIGRDGAGVVEVLLRLRKALRTLQQADCPGFASAAEAQDRIVLARAEQALPAVDMERLRAIDR